MGNHPGLPGKTALSNAKLSPDKTAECFLNFWMARNRAYFPIIRISVYVMAATVALQITSGCNEFFSELISFHT